MKILHIMYYDAKFTETIIGFYNKFFYEHQILLINTPLNKQEKLKNYSNIFLETVSPHSINDNLNVYSYLKHFDQIVLHSLNLSTFLLMFLLFTNKIKKFIWIEWGKDLYDWRDNQQKLIIRFIKNRINYLFRHKIPYFIAIFPPDIDVYKQFFKNSQAKIFYAPYTGYPDGNKGKAYNTTRKLSDIINKKETLYVQIGHNAMLSLNHIEVLDALKDFSKENIRIILPLSYGNKEYADKVELYAKELFGDKVICLREFLPPNEYFDIVNKVSICIFNTQRQCALGNIHHMIFRNVKLFMPQDSVMFNYFNSRGVPIYKFEDIGKMDFKEFTSDVSIQDMSKFNNYIDELTNYDKKISLWKNIYDEIEKDYKK